MMEKPCKKYNWLEVVLHPIAPAFVTSLLLLLGALISSFIGFAGAQELLSLSILSSLLLGVLLGTRHLVLPVIKWPEPLPLLFVMAASFVLVLELLIFGVPLLGQVSYTEFGLPILHHLVAMQWIAILFSENRRFTYLLISVVSAILIFNRQLILLSIISFLISSNISVIRSLSLGALSLASIILLGLYRSTLQGAEISNVPFLQVSDQVFSSLFFIVLYILGPFQTVFSDNDPLWERFFQPYWNTVPEWALFNSAFDVNAYLSFVLFYGFFFILVIYFSKLKSKIMISFSTILHTMLFFTFFSRIVLTSSFIAIALALVGIGTFLLIVREKYDSRD